MARRPNCYGILKKAIDKLMKADIILEDTSLNTIRRINICSEAIYKKNDGMIEIKFTDSIMPYLSQVKQRFILYNLKEIANFGSLYTTRLYELIQEFKETGWVLKSVEQLRIIFAVSNKFKLYGHFKNKIINHACQEINANYNIGLSFEEIKEGRKVVAIKFFFKQTIVHKVVNQKTGISKNIYIKPKPQTKANKKVKHELSKSPDVLEGQLSFNDLKTEAKPLKNILSSLLTKFIKKS